MRRSLDVVAAREDTCPPVFGNVIKFTHENLVGTVDKMMEGEKEDDWRNRR